jgi:hypothetical protein
MGSVAILAFSGQPVAAADVAVESLSRGVFRLRSFCDCWTARLSRHAAELPPLGAFSETR